MVMLRSVPPPSEGVRHEQAETTAVLDGKGLGAGTLYVAETRLSWFDGSGMGFSLEYPTISLHAISRDLSAYPQEHLYVMVNAKLNDEMQENAHDDEDKSSEEDESEGITEIRFVPSNKAALESMFSAMCECQALHPDPDDEDSDGDFDGDEYDVEEAEADGMEVDAGSTVAGQFEDADVDH
ncbi:methylosome subunit pICln isoform X3 [Coregonus clupeaformis]|uniref:methylosome subunit pICln isoform X3 n=1 Tax=Coregonus clupeaformis TaxID=59861 RepID=UPI001E1C42AB|nr:methylosome subunit pICln isoform X3 [Coregonus clupeaformis]